MESFWSIGGEGFNTLECEENKFKIKKRKFTLCFMFHFIVFKKLLLVEVLLLTILPF